MANETHLAVLQRGVTAWNQWRRAYSHVRPDLAKAPLAGKDLRWANLSQADLTGTHLRGADLSEADLRGADLSGTDLIAARLLCASLSGTDLRRTLLAKADLRGADLSRANLTGTDLREANLTGTDLRGANLTGADLKTAILIHTHCEGATLTGCRVYGIAAWDIDLVGAQQSDLVITRDGEPVITVDNIEVAQFIYLLLHNEKLRYIIETITSKAVLILGRFTPERKAVLDALREALRPTLVIISLAPVRMLADRVWSS